MTRPGTSPNRATPRPIPSGARWIATGALLLGLLAVRAITRPSDVVLASVAVEMAHRHPEGAELANRVRYSDVFTHEGGALRVTSRGAARDRGVGEFALVPEEGDDVRVLPSEIPGEITFERVPAGTWSLRATARGTEGEVVSEAHRDGTSWEVFGLAFAALCAPLWLLRR